MDLGISGKVAFVTGGSRGMGRIVAEMLAAEGCKVGIVARTKADVDEVVAAINASGGTAMGAYGDIANEADCKRVVAEVTAALGAPQIVIGQTKHNVPGDFLDITELEHYVDAFRVYTMSHLYLLHAVLPAMKEAGWGRVVHIGSGTAKEPVGNIHHVIANATRPSTIGLLKTVADEFAGFGITVNTVAPGWIATDNMYQYLARMGLDTPEQVREFMVNSARVPMGRAGTPAEIASAITYLCSEAAGFITGNWIEVDGGAHRSAF